MDIFVNCVRNDYSNFDGKATRKEFWTFTAYFAVITMAIAFVTGFLSGLTTVVAIKYLYLVFVFLMTVPFVAAGVRRLHDVGKSGKYLLVGLIPFVGIIILIVWFCGNTAEVKKGNNVKK